MDQLPLRAIQRTMEGSAKTTLSTDWYKKITPPLGNCHAEEITYDTMGYVAIPEHSTSLTDWPNIYGQSLLIKHSNK